MIHANDPCTLCGSSDSSLKHVLRFEAVPYAFELRRCDGCGLLFNSPRPENLADFYDAGYYVFQDSEVGRYQRAFQQVRRHLDPALWGGEGALRVLEIGSAQGCLLHVLRCLGHEVQGVEISTAAAQESRDRFGIEVFNGTVEDFLQANGQQVRNSFDIVWCNDVLEHTSDPVDFVVSCAQLLKPGGRLILDTPNAGARAVREDRPNWGAYNPYHIYLFGPDNIGLLLGKAGLTLRHKFSYNNAPATGLVVRRPLRSALRRILKAVGVLYRLRKWRAARRDGPPAQSAMSRDQVMRSLDAIPWYSASDDAHAEDACGLRGDNLVVHAVKP